MPSGERVALAASEARRELAAPVVLAVLPGLVVWAGLLAPAGPRGSVATVVRLVRRAWPAVVESADWGALAGPAEPADWGAAVVLVELGEAAATVVCPGSPGSAVLEGWVEAASVVRVAPVAWLERVGSAAVVIFRELMARPGCRELRGVPGCPEPLEFRVFPEIRVPVAQWGRSERGVLMAAPQRTVRRGRMAHRGVPAGTEMRALTGVQARMVFPVLPGWLELPEASDWRDLPEGQELPV